MNDFFSSADYLEIESKLKILASDIWDNAIKMPQIEAWLSQFTGQILSEEEEKLYMSLALSKFIFFSQRMIREMLISLYRDYFRTPIIHEIRKANNHTTNFELLNNLYNEELKLSRFISVGNPAESGAHLLYIFRQVNDLKKFLFRDLYHAFNAESDENGKIKWIARDINIKRYVFFDDFVGGGTQITGYLKDTLANIKENNPDIQISFISIFSTTQGLEVLNHPNVFDGNAVCLFELDESFKSCTSGARYFKKVEWFNMENFKKIIEHYGSPLYSNPFGHSDCELLIGFSHNTPNNTLPVFWKDGYIPEMSNSWFPIFKRFEKNYGSVRS
ncbi:phosphoribosyltransferase-like protein [Acinetobacter bereziniae]|uniref:phosphoribosyltransferase-like protein n=1 Tax=Acinetobacter bereziniae TaxID=106648 RepID=UPI00124F7CB5|nr:hypothetical protein [Acinetobacter bereziniae]